MTLEQLGSKLVNTANNTVCHFAVVQTLFFKQTYQDVHTDLFPLVSSVVTWGQPQVNCSTVSVQVLLINQTMFSLLLFGSCTEHKSDIRVQLKSVILNINQAKVSFLPVCVGCLRSRAGNTNVFFFWCFTADGIHDVTLPPPVDRHFLTSVSLCPISFISLIISTHCCVWYNLALYV